MSDENTLSDSVESPETTKIEPEVLKISPEVTRVNKEEKRIFEYTSRIKRTLIACFAGTAAGIASYYTQGISLGENAADSQIYLAFFLMLAAIVIQKHIFMILRIDPSGLGKKDWFYQGFMTFAFWFVSWTFLMSGSSVM